MRISTLSLLAIALTSATALNAASSFGINFSSVAVDGTTGDYLGTSAWTNTFGQAGTASSGTVNTTETGVTAQFASSGYWKGGQWGTAGTANQGLNVFRNYLDDGDAIGGSLPSGLTGTNSDGIGVSLRIDGLASWLLSNDASAYQITVLLSSDQAFATGSFHNVTAYTVSGSLLQSATSTVQGTGNWDGLGIATGDGPGQFTNQGIRGSATLLGLTDDSVVITLPVRDGTTRGTVAGLVVTAIPEPSTYGLIGAGALGAVALIRRRRRAK